MTVEDLKKYKDGLYSSLSRDLEAFEKNFIIISSGILAFSITFIQDIVKIENAEFLIILFIGWFLILCAVGLMMFAFLHSVKGSNVLWKIADDFIIAENLFTTSQPLTTQQIITIKTNINNQLYKIKKQLGRTRIIAILSFIIGLLCVSIFVSFNLIVQSQKGKLINSREGKKSLDNNKLLLYDTIYLKTALEIEQSKTVITKSTGEDSSKTLRENKNAESST